MAEWSMAVVLKTTEPGRVPGVRIPLSPPTFARHSLRSWLRLPSHVSHSSMKVVRRSAGDIYTARYHCIASLRALLRLARGSPRTSEFVRGRRLVTPSCCSSVCRSGVRRFAGMRVVSPPADLSNACDTAQSHRPGVCQALSWLCRKSLCNRREGTPACLASHRLWCPTVSCLAP